MSKPVRIHLASGVMLEGHLTIENEAKIGAGEPGWASIYDFDRREQLRQPAKKRIMDFRVEAVVAMESWPEGKP